MSDPFDKEPPPSGTADGVTRSLNAAVTRVETTVVPPEASSSVRDLDFGERYRLRKVLGRGGMGEVYHAYDTELSREVALKVIHEDRADRGPAVERFKRETALASKITHPNVLRVYDLSEHGGLRFLSMQYVDGEDLASLLHREHPLGLARALRLFRQIGEGLHAAHEQGVVHRDLKPHNVLVDKNDHVYVADFGLARSLVDATVTVAGTLLGSPAYMSPEQVKGDPTDTRSDIYSLGVILYELVTGNLPFKGDTAHSIMEQRLHRPPPAAREVVTNLPPYIDRVLARCLALEPGDRYGSVRELLVDLDDTRTPPASRRRKGSLLFGALAAAGVLLVGGVVWLVVERHAGSRAVATHSPAASASLPLAAPGQAVTVLVADVVNQTGDPTFDRTLEPMLDIALEQASFINAFSRGDARKLAQELPHPSDKLDPAAARLVAVSQGIGAVVAASLGRSPDGYTLAAEVIDAVTGGTVTKAKVAAPSKDEVVRAVPRLAAGIRKALGDTTPESVQLAAAEGAFTAASLEVVQDYAQGLEAQLAGNSEEALRSFSKAAELDPSFARAYSGMAAAARNLGRLDDSVKYIKLAMEHVDRMTERERYRIRGVYYRRLGDYPKCVEEYGELVKQYPADVIGHNNLGLCYLHVLNLPKAIEEEQKAVELSPKAAMMRVNLSAAALYAGDFTTGEREARKALELNPRYTNAFVVLAYAELLQDRLSEAAETYGKLRALGGFGETMAEAGLADLACYEGRFGDAVQILEPRVAADDTANPERAADDLTTLAYAELLRGHTKAALDATERALGRSKRAKVRFLAARAFVAAGKASRARKLAAGLGAELSVESQAYAKVIEGEVALQSRDYRRAIKALGDASGLLDTWIGRFDLVRAYLGAGLYAEADSELDRCIKRRGEVLELFDDDVPTYGFFPPVYYYQGRVREGLKSPGAAESYRSYLRIRGKAGEDPLLAEVRRRLGE